MSQHKKQFIGQFYEIEHENDAFDGDISEAIITDTKIAIDWEEEDGEKCHAKLTSDDGYFYQGDYSAGTQSTIGKIEGYLYKSDFDEHVFWMEWLSHETGYEGHSILFLERPEEDNS